MPYNVPEELMPPQLRRRRRLGGSIFNLPRIEDVPPRTPDFNPDIEQEGKPGPRGYGGLVFGNGRREEEFPSASDIATSEQQHRDLQLESRHAEFHKPVGWKQALLQAGRRFGPIVIGGLLGGEAGAAGAAEGTAEALGMQQAQRERGHTSLMDEIREERARKERKEAAQAAIPLREARIRNLEASTARLNRPEPPAALKETPEQAYQRRTREADEMGLKDRDRVGYILEGDLPTKRQPTPFTAFMGGTEEKKKEVGEFQNLGRRPQRPSSLQEKIDLLQSDPETFKLIFGREGIGQKELMDLARQLATTRGQMGTRVDRKEFISWFNYLKELLSGQEGSQGVPLASAVPSRRELGPPQGGLPGTPGLAASPRSGLPARPGSKFVTQKDIQDAASEMGMSYQDVLEAFRAKGYILSGPVR